MSMSSVLDTGAHRTKFSVLALDGGGIRGVIPARVLQEIEERLRRPVCELFDLVAGTSTGGIIALGLTKPKHRGARMPAYSASALVDLYIDHGTEIFPRSRWRKAATLGGLIGVRYSAKPLEALLERSFGDAMLSEALTEVVIPSYDLSAPDSFFFKRAYPRENEKWDVRMSSVARATSAAPTYFDPAPLPDFDGEGPHALIDGGVYVNNPAVSGYADALDLFEDVPEIHVVSIGTGKPPRSAGRGTRIPVAYARARHWGLARWARPVLEVVFDGVAQAVEYQLKRLCRHGDGSLPRYHRLQSTLPTANHQLDDASPGNLERLMDDAHTLLRDDGDKLDAICTALADVAVDRDAARQAPA